jgi:hypothetical protein
MPESAEVMRMSLKLVNTKTTAANSICMLSEVKKAHGGEDGIYLEFRIIMRICMRESTVPVKTRSVKITWKL